MTSRIFLLAVIISVTLFSIQPVRAHGAARLEISPERLSPGAPLTIRGVDFSYEQDVILTLVGKDYELPLGVFVTDLDGIFANTMILPVDLQEGTYYVRANTAELEVLSPAITLQGTPVINNEDDAGQRELEEPLLAPMPTYAAGVSSTAISQALANRTAAESKQSPKISKMAFMVAIVILVLLGVRILKKR